MSEKQKKPIIIVTHSKFVLDRAILQGWKAGARYTNLRDVKHLRSFYFLDIDWKNYDYPRHIGVMRDMQPRLTVARDVVDIAELAAILREAEALGRDGAQVIIVPKDPALARLPRLGVPEAFRLGYSVPTRYGATSLPTELFTGEVHLLGGRPDVQRRLAYEMDVHSVDGNRFTFDAKFGDFFDGVRFLKHPVGGYDRCLRESIANIDLIWTNDNER